MPDSSMRHVDYFTKGFAIRQIHLENKNPETRQLRNSRIYAME